MAEASSLMDMPEAELDLQAVRQTLIRLLDLARRTGVGQQTRRRLLAAARDLEAVESRADPEATQAPDS
eukprot:3672255-Prymnesium_polylepis.1